MLLNVTSWNINSVRLRIAQVVAFLQEHKPDILCLQEIKTPEKDFPYDAFAQIGYPYSAVAGQKGYHGVAIIANTPITNIERDLLCNNSDARHIRVTAKHDIIIDNFYVLTIF